MVVKLIKTEENMKKKINEDIIFIIQIIVVPLLWYISYSLLDEPYSWFAYCITTIGVFYLGKILKK